MDRFLDHVDPGKTNHRLLGGWRDLFEDIQKLALSIDQVPEHCACGHGGDHLRATCECCVQSASARSCVDCDSLIRQIAERTDALWADDWRFSDVLRDLATRRPDSDKMHHGIDNVAGHGLQLVRIVEQVQVAAADFRQGCRVDQLAGLKERVRELRDEAKRLDRQW